MLETLLGYTLLGLQRAALQCKLADREHQHVYLLMLSCLLSYCCNIWGTVDLEIAYMQIVRKTCVPDDCLAMFFVSSVDQACHVAH